MRLNAVRLYGRVSLRALETHAVRLYCPGDARSASLQVPIDKTEQRQ